MATKSLGTLTLDLVAKTGSFIQGMDKAGRASEKWRKDVTRNLKLVTGAGAALAAGFLAKFISETQQSEKEQAQLAAVLRSTGEAAGYTRAQLNAMADAMEATSTISAGEINQAQTTLLAFTGIAGEEFPRALQAAIDMASRTGMSVVSASETIGRALDIPSAGLSALSKQGFRFTEDQKKVAKALEDSGRTAEAQAIILNALEESYGGAAQAARNTFSGAMTAVKNSVNALMTGEDGSLTGATAALDDLNTVLRDPETKAAVDAIAQAFITLSGAIASVVSTGVSLTKFIAESIAAEIYGPASDDIARLETRLQKLRDEQSKGWFTRDFRWFDDDKLAYEIKIVESQVNDFYNNISKPSVNVAPAVVAAAPVIDEAEILRQKELADAIEKQRQARVKQVEAIQRQIDAITAESRMIGMNADQQKIYRLQLEGATEAQLNQARASLELIAAHERQAEIQKDYEGLVKSLRTEEERRLDTLKEQMAVMDAITGITDEQRKLANSRIASGAIDSDSGISVGNDKKSLDKNASELENWYSQQLDALENYRKERADLNSEWDEEELKIKEEYEARKTEIETANEQLRREQQTQGYLAILDVMSQFYSGMEGEQAAYTRAALAMGATLLDEKKRESLMSIIGDTNSAAMGAYDAMASIPYVGPFLGAAAAGAVYVAGGVAAAKVSGMAHDGIDSIPEDGTWLLEKGERVTTAETSARLDKMLNQIDRNLVASNGGSNGVTQNIYVEGKPDRRTSSQIARDSAREQRLTAQRLGG